MEGLARPPCDFGDVLIGFKVGGLGRRYLKRWYTERVSNWQEAETIMKAIETELKQQEPDLERALENVKQVRSLIPDLPFQQKGAFQALQPADMRIILLRGSLDQLEQGIAKPDPDLALKSLASVLRAVQELGRKASA